MMAHTEDEGRSPTQLQVSAGGVVYRCTPAGELEVALIATHLGERWSLPKGQVEAGESLEQTALREVHEETGLEAEIIEALAPIEYWYWWSEGTRKTRHHKRVHFFLMLYRRGALRPHDFEVADVRWFPIDDAIARSSYESERRLLRFVKERLASACEPVAGAP